MIFSQFMLFENKQLCWRFIYCLLLQHCRKFVGDAK